VVGELEQAREYHRRQAWASACDTFQARAFPRSVATSPRPDVGCVEVTRRAEAGDAPDRRVVGVGTLRAEFVSLERLERHILRTLLLDPAGRRPRRGSTTDTKQGKVSGTGTRRHGYARSSPTPSVTVAIARNAPATCGLRTVGALTTLVYQGTQQSHTRSRTIVTFGRGRGEECPARAHIAVNPLICRFRGTGPASWNGAIRCVDDHHSDP